MREYIQPFTLPEGWIERVCSKNTISILTTKSNDTSCNPDKPYAAITMFISDNLNAIDPTDCASTKAKQDTAYDGFISYGCENITVNGKKGLRQLLVENEKSVYATPSTLLSYVFHADEKLITLSYLRLTGRDESDYTIAFDSFVKSLNFR